MAIMVSSMISLAAQHAPGAASFVVFDGTPADSNLAGTFARVQEAIPHKMQLVEWRAVEETITVTGASNDVNVRTASGTIRVAGNPAASSTWEMHTASGSVELIVPPTANFLFSANAVSGGISTDIPIVVEEQGRHELRARLGNGGARVQVRTVSGGIRLRGSNSAAL